MKKIRKQALSKTQMDKAAGGGNGPLSKPPAPPPQQWKPGPIADYGYNAAKGLGSSPPSPPPSPAKK